MRILLLIAFAATAAGCGSGSPPPNPDFPIPELPGKDGKQPAGRVVPQGKT